MTTGTKIALAVGGGLALLVGFLWWRRRRAAGSPSDGTVARNAPLSGGTVVAGAAAALSTQAAASVPYDARAAALLWDAYQSPNISAQRTLGGVRRISDVPTQGAYDPPPAPTGDWWTPTDTGSPLDAFGDLVPGFEATNYGDFTSPLDYND